MEESPSCCKNGVDSVKNFKKGMHDFFFLFTPQTFVLLRLYSTDHLNENKLLSNRPTLC